MPRLALTNDAGPAFARWRRAAAIALIVAPLCTSFSAAAAQVALLIERKTSLYEQAAQGFQKGFGGEFKVIQGNGDSRYLDAKLHDLRKDRPNLIVAIGTRAAQAARQHLRGVPLLYCLALNPAQNQLAGTDIGGIILNIDPAKQLAIIQKVLPQARRIGVIYDEPVSGKLVRQAREYLNPGVRLVARDAPNPQEAAKAIEELQGQIDAFWMLWDPVVANPANFKLLVDFSLKNRAPLIAPAAVFVEAGALMSVEPDYVRAGREAGEIAQQVLSGKRSLPSEKEPPGEPVITINGSVARRFGIQIPRDLPAEILSPGER